MDEIIQSLTWESHEDPLPGSHSTLPDDNVLPWKCVSEVIPGLFLTCESEAADRTRCAEKGVALVINLCGESHVSKYRVYEKAENGAYKYRRFESQSNFCATLNDYCRAAPSTALSQRKVFVVTIAAEDVPTYSIDLHFLECAVLIELVLRSRNAAPARGIDTTTDYFALPSVVVHCMVGVSRSASIVVAYMMKKYDMPRDAAISFIRFTRPVIQPNPGFQRQLELWETLKGCRIVDEMSAKVLSLETRSRCNLLEVVSTILPTILRTNKCDKERQYFGTLVKDVTLSEEVLHAVYRELRSIVTADVDCEVYTDIPNYFGYVAEVICSIDAAVPSLLQHSSLSRAMIACNDTFYYRVAKDIARSGFEKDTFDTIRGFCSLFEAIYVKHLSKTGNGRPRVLEGETELSSFPGNCGVSFPFLFFVAPYAEGFVRFSEWDALTETFPTTGPMLAHDEAQQLQMRLINVFLQFFFQSSSTETKSAFGDAYTKLGYLQNDIEVETFRKLENLWQQRAFPVESLDSVVPTPQTDEPQIFSMLALKTISGVLAFRLVLEAADQFLAQTYTARIIEVSPVADELLSLPVVLASVATLDAAYVAQYGTSFCLSEFFHSELSSLRESGVLKDTGVVSLFHPL